jgi:hypothetical protein
MKVIDTEPTNMHMLQKAFQKNKFRDAFILSDISGIRDKSWDDENAWDAGILLNTNSKREPFICRIDFKNREWVFEIYGRTNIDIIKKLAKFIKKNFDIKVKLILKTEESKNEVFYGEYGD